MKQLFLLLNMPAVKYCLILFCLFIQVVRLACYACKLYGCVQDEKPWQSAGSRLSNARMMLRLFDDIPMIRHTYNYGLGRHVGIN